MRKNGKISPYVKALWELGIEETDLEDIREILRENPKLKKVLEDPRVSRQDKSRVVDRVFPEAHKGLLQTLVKHETVALLDDMKTGLQAEKDKRERRITVRLSYVTPPSVQEKDQMEILLKQKFAASEVRWLEEEKPELLGGFLLQVNGWEYDYSTRGRWLELKRGLIRR